MSTQQKKNDILMLVIVKIVVYLVSILYVCLCICICVCTFIFDLAKLRLCYKYSGDYIFKSIYALNTLL